MKSDLVHPRVQVEPAILQRLVTEVKETVATDVAMPQAKTPSQAKKSSFGALNLWAIRRNRRTVYGRKQPNIVNGFGY
ncbi:MAG TPA: hypothetical protein VG605_18495 [Puia sp.]|nr:hypothetical protein [Puia sp.]